MAKIHGRVAEWKIIVEPRMLNDFGAFSIGEPQHPVGSPQLARYERDMDSRCESIVAAIKRHADDVKHVRVEKEYWCVCSFCGKPIYEGDDFCELCPEGAAEMEARQAEKVYAESQRILNEAAGKAVAS